MKLIITFLSFFIFNISNAQNWMQSQILDRKFNQAVSNYNSGKFIVSEKIILEILSGEPGIYKEPSLLLLFKNEIALDNFPRLRALSCSRNFAITVLAIIAASLGLGL